MKFEYGTDFMRDRGVEIIEKYACKRAGHKVKCTFTFNYFSYKIIMNIIDNKLTPISNCFLINLMDARDEIDLLSNMTTIIDRLYPEEVEKFEPEPTPPVLIPLICPQCGGTINPETLECDFCKTKFVKGVVA